MLEANKAVFKEFEEKDVVHIYLFIKYLSYSVN